MDMSNQASVGVQKSAKQNDCPRLVSKGSRYTEAEQHA